MTETTTDLETSATHTLKGESMQKVHGVSNANKGVRFVKKKSVNQMQVKGIGQLFKVRDLYVLKVSN